MVAALPRNIQLKLEQTLAQWRQWRCDPPLAGAPEVAAVLGQGVSNFSILVGATRQFVVRIDGVNPATHGLNRQTEWRALQAASAAGLAPGPRYFNPDLGSLVCDYLPPQERQDLDMADVAALLKSIHQLPARHNRLDLGERILRYEKHLEHRRQTLPGVLVRCRGKVMDILGTVNSGPQATALCHNDLLRANRIYSGGRLWAIDWEYCAMGSPWYDLAVIAIGDSLSPAQTTALLEAYLGRPTNSAEQTQSRLHGCLYRYLELLWYLALDHAAVTPPQLQEKLAGLEQALLTA